MAQCGNIGLMMGFVATIGILFCLGSKQWQKNSQVSSQQVNRGLYSYEGLWVRCTSYTQGQFQCDNFDESYLALPAALQCQRAFMVVAGLFAVCGLVAGTVGQSCVHALEGKPKLYSARSGGILMLIAGALTLTSVSWYAAEVVREYWKDQMLDSAFQYEFGAALYIGWISSGLALLSGFLMAFCSAVEDEVEYGHNYTYSPHKQQPMPKSGHNTEYV